MKIPIRNECCTIRQGIYRSCPTIIFKRIPFPFYVDAHGGPVKPSLQQSHAILTFSQSIPILISGREHNNEGTVPLNCSLLYIYKLFICIKFPNVDGMLPLKILKFKLNSVSSIKFPNSEGIVPNRLLSNKFKVVSSVRFPMVDGIVPLN